MRVDYLYSHLFDRKLFAFDIFQSFSLASTLQSGKAVDGQGFLGTCSSIFRGSVTQLPLKSVFPEGESGTHQRSQNTQAQSKCGW